MIKIAKNNKKRIQQAADYISNITPLVARGVEFLPEFKATLKHLKETKNKIVSGSAIIGDSYRVKELNCEYRINRLAAWINLLETYTKSEEIIAAIKQANTQGDSMRKLFGI